MAEHDIRAVARDPQTDRLPEHRLSFPDFDREAVRAELEEQIRARPILSVVIAVAAGFLFGRLLRS